MLVGIVVRGAGFTFRGYDNSPIGKKRWNRGFAVPSMLTPIMLGTIVGAIASGRVGQSPDGPVPLFSTWLRPFPLTVGLFTLAIFSYLAAVYLTLETDEPELREDFRAMALIAAVAVGALAYAVYLLARRDAPLVFRGLDASFPGRPVRLATGACAILALLALWRRWYQLARASAMIQVALILWGCALAQWPYIVPPTMTAANSSAPPIVLKMLLGALAAGSLVLFPSLYYMIRVFKGHTFAARGARGGNPRPS
jgi:cytochrome d ubiquinol oxidase subunit II